MKKSVKRILAKEIIIFFSITFLIVLISTCFLLINEYNIRKTENLKNQIVKSDSNIDSIQSTFPKIKSFEEVIIGKVPVEYLIEEDWEKYRVCSEESNEELIKILGYPDNKPLSINKIDSEREKNRVTNLHQLHRLLITSKFKFSHNPFINISVEDWCLFKDQIITDLENDSSKYFFLDKIYFFLIDQNYINIDFKEFKYILNAIATPPEKNILIKYQNEVKMRDILKNKLTKYNNKLYSKDDLIYVTELIAIIMFSLIYPFRIIVYLIRWAIKTLKETAKNNSL